MVSLTLIAFLKRELLRLEYTDVQINGDVVKVPSEEADKIQALEEFNSRYQRLQQVLAKQEREYDVTPLEDLIELQRGKFAIRDFVIETSIGTYVGDKCREIVSAIEVKEQADFAVMRSCFPSDDVNENIRLAKQKGLSDEQIKERNELYRAVGYICMYFEEKPGK